MINDNPPQQLTETGMRYWNELLSQVKAKGWTEGRRRILWLVCDQLALYCIAKEEIQLNGITIQGPSGAVKANPALGTQKQAYGHILSGMKELELGKPEIEDLDNDLDDFMKGE